MDEVTKLGTLKAVFDTLKKWTRRRGKNNTINGSFSKVKTGGYFF